MATTKKRLHLQALNSWLLALLVLWLPINLFLSFYRQSAYVHGLLVDYLLPKFYLSDIPVILMMVTAMIGNWQKHRSKKINLSRFFNNSLLLWGLILLILLIARQFFTPIKTAALWYLLKIGEMAWLWTFLKKRPQLLTKSVVKLAFWLSLISQALIGIYQYFFQSNLLPYKFLGETNFARSMVLAKDIWWQTGQILPYGSTPHPNILAGTLVIFWLIWSHQFKTSRKENKTKLNRVIWLVTTFLVGSCLFLSQSISAFLALAVGLIISRCSPNKQIKQKLGLTFFSAWLLTPIIIQLSLHLVPKWPAISRRAQLNTAASRMIMDRPFWGIGLNHFTYYLEDYSQRFELVRFVQPAHHLGLLWLAETGFSGAVILGWFWLWLKKQKFDLFPSLLILMPMATLDHYLLTQQTGLLLLVITTAYWGKILKIKKQPTS